MVVGGESTGIYIREPPHHVYSPLPYSLLYSIYNYYYTTTTITMAQERAAP